MVAHLTSHTSNFQWFSLCAFLWSKSSVYRYSKAADKNYKWFKVSAYRDKGVVYYWYLSLLFNFCCCMVEHQEYIFYPFALNELSSKDFTMPMLIFATCIPASTHSIIYGQGSRVWATYAHACYYLTIEPINIYSIHMYVCLLGISQMIATGF